MGGEIPRDPDLVSEPQARSPRAKAGGRLGHVGRPKATTRVSGRTEKLCSSYTSAWLSLCRGSWLGGLCAVPRARDKRGKAREQERNDLSQSRKTALGEAILSLSTREAQRWSMGRTAPAFISTVTSESCRARWGLPDSCLCCGVSGKAPQGGCRGGEVAGEEQR